MTNTVKRLLLFLIAIPLLTVLILFLPQYGHAGIIVLITAVGFIGGMEMRAMLGGMPAWTALIPAAAPLLAWLTGMGFISRNAVSVVFAAGVGWALISPAFAGGSPPESPGKRLLMLMYPGYLLWWTARLTWFDNAGIIIFIFMLTVYLNDSLAWAAGMLFGRHKGIFRISPNKSAEGYLGGIFASVVVILAASRLYPQILPHPLWQLILFAAAAAFTSIFGDLGESALKRSVGVKDSGTIIPGRGGMLDSVDSILMTAPVFVIFLGGTLC